MLKKKRDTVEDKVEQINQFDAEIKALEEHLQSMPVSATSTGGLSTGSATTTNTGSMPQWGQGYPSGQQPYNHTWKRADPELEDRVKDLEEQMAKLIRSGIDKMEINTIGDLQHFLETLVMKLDDLIALNPDVDKAYDCDNIRFLLKELEDEINKWTEAS